MLNRFSKRKNKREGLISFFVSLLISFSILYLSYEYAIKPILYEKMQYKLVGSYSSDVINSKAKIIANAEEQKQCDVQRLFNLIDIFIKIFGIIAMFVAVFISTIVSEYAKSVYQRYKASDDDLH